MMNKVQELYETGKVKIHIDTSDATFEKYADDIARLLKPEVEDKILDIGCGSGEITKKIKNKYHLTVTGMDFCNRLLQKAREMDQSIQWVYHDALERWPFKDQEFNKIYSYTFFQYVPPNKVEHVLSEIYRVLKPGGTACMMSIHDKSKFLKAFDSKVMLVKYGLKSYLTNIACTDDNSYWHNIKNIRKISNEVGMSSQVFETQNRYRIHLLLKKL